MEEKSHGVTLPPPRPRNSHFSNKITSIHQQIPMYSSISLLSYTHSYPLRKSRTQLLHTSNTLNHESPDYSPIITHKHQRHRLSINARSWRSSSLLLPTPTPTSRLLLFLAISISFCLCHHQFLLNDRPFRISRHFWCSLRRFIF